MKLIPNYSYEFNIILNEDFNEDEQVKNFASLISDKDRFLQFLPLIEQNKDLIEERLGSILKDSYDFFVVRAEKFKSFSLPVTIEYSILPEEMIVFLLKEIVKVSVPHRFPDDVSREQYVNAFVEHILINGDFGKFKLIKFAKNLHDESKCLFVDYEFKEVDYSSKTLTSYVEELYSNF